MSSDRTLVRRCAGVLGIVVALRLLTLGLYPLTDPTEARYAEMARKMLDTGNWLTPMFDVGVPFWGKPPLAFWMSALPIDRKSTRLNSSHLRLSRMPSSA